MPLISTKIIEYKITSVLFDLMLGVITLNVSQGYKDGANFVTLTEFDVPVSQDKTAELFAILPTDPDKDLYSNVKGVLYNYLIENNALSGTIE